MKSTVRVALFGIVSTLTIACRPAMSPERDEATLRSHVLTLYRPHAPVDASPEPVTAEPAAVEVQLPGADHRIGGSCTAALTDVGVLTAAHCVAHDSSVIVRSPEGKDVTAKVARIDAWLDLALLQPETALPKTLTIPLASSPAASGAHVEALGTTRFGFGVFARGTSLGSRDLGPPRTLVDMPAWPGLSGGPIVRADGPLEIVGVASGWLNLDPEGHVRMLEIVPVDAVSEFLANRPIASVRAAIAFAQAHREEKTFRLYVTTESRESRGNDEVRMRVRPQVMRGDLEIDTPVSLSVRSDGKTIEGTVHDGTLEWPVSQNMTVVASTPGLLPETFDMVRRGGFSYLVPETRLRFELGRGLRVHDDAWLDFSWSAMSGAGFTGHAVLLRPLVLHDGAVVGVGTECFYNDVGPESPIDCANVSGRVWAPSAGTYDVVLMSGSTPIAYERWEVPAHD